MFKAILLKQCRNRERGAIVEVVAGSEGLEGRWVVLLPVDLAGAELVPLVDADRAISTLEAAHIFSYRRGPGWTTHRRRVCVYIDRGLLAPAGRAREDIGGSKRPAVFVGLEATWKMPFPTAAGHPKPQKQEDDKDGKV